MKFAAVLATVLLVGLSFFQIALAAGAPWGAASWGGTHAGTLPRGLRIASGLAGVVVYPLLILVTLAAAGIVEVSWLPVPGAGWMWVLTAFFAVGTLANLASRSRIERWWGPVSGVVAGCCAVIAVSL